MNVPKELLYTESHEWVRADDDACTVGVTDFAQSQLSDLTYVELPEVGDTVDAGDEIAVLESVKAASDVYSPVSGRIVEVNTAAAENPDLINKDPYGDGWLFKVEPSDEGELDKLMDADQYEDGLPQA
jgi:glycine cleavage system H protein